VVAIGECGLDHQHYTSKRDIEQQAEVFENQLQIAKGKHIPVVIHCRGDEQLNDLCLSVMVKTLPKDHHIPQALVSGNFFLPRYYIYTTRYVTVHW
jgi:Tat protein secretion system quality control protein TatD with DNase activity